MPGLTINRVNYLIETIEWSYFIGEYKPKQQNYLERIFRSLTDTDKNSVRGLRILLETIEEDLEMKKDLGVNPFNLYSIGLQSYINFKDISNLVAYKVEDYSMSSELFGDKKIKDALELSNEKLKQEILATIHHDHNYLSNFSKSYIVIALPSSLSDKDFDFEEILANEGMIKYQYLPEKNQITFYVK